LRRITSALTKGALVAIVGVSTVKAQQSGPAGAEPIDQIASSAKAAQRPSGKPVGDPVYGMSSTRGARYLLRNGLDYLDYGEYQRALKFLRETESRKNELNDAEILVLKRSIERAQRGLREAADVASTYALSDQARNRNGFNPARPDARAGSQADLPKLSAHGKSMLKQSYAPRSTVGDSDDQGEPIRLARGDDAQGDLSPHETVTPKTSRTSGYNSTDRHDSDQPRQFPEIPQLPKRSQEHSELAAQPPNATGPGHAPYIEPAQNENSTKVAADPAPQLQPADTAAASDDSPALAHAETEEFTPAQMLNQSSGDSGTPASPSLPTLSPMEEAGQTALPQTRQSIKVGVSDEKNEPVPFSTTTAPTPIIASATGTDEIPPLPASLSESATSDHSIGKLAPITTSANDLIASARAVSGDLPPLPNDPGHSVARSVDPQAPFAAPNAAPDLPNASPSTAQDPSIATSDATHDSSPPSVKHEEVETLPPLPGQDKDPPVATPPSGGAILPPADSITQAQIAVARPELPLGGADSGGRNINSRSLEPNSNPGQEVVAPVAPTSDVSDTPSLLPPAIEASGASSSRIDSMIPSRPAPPSTLRPELKREVESIARKQEDDLRRRQQAQPAAPARDTIISDLRAQTQLDISRAPSPAEARPIKAIPVPEDWVPLAPRTWSAQRKYWAAAATCHLPLYFQDPMLERYGHSVEQFVGPIGRYLTYPLDDPTQSTQRNQILQPFFSAGLFAFQIAALPYNVIVDPPWEAPYDLGYYRPGDVIPTDTYWLPLHGYGPPLHGSSY
jgi:hypothetical protein